MPSTGREKLSKAEIALQQYDERRRKRREKEEKQSQQSLRAMSPGQPNPPHTSQYMHVSTESNVHTSTPPIPPRRRGKQSSCNVTPETGTRTPNNTNNTARNEEDSLHARLAVLKEGLPLDAAKDQSLEARLERLNENSYYVRNHRDGVNAGLGYESSTKKHCLPPAEKLSFEDEVEILLNEAKDSAMLTNRDVDGIACPTYAIEPKNDLGSSDTNAENDSDWVVGKVDAKTARGEIKKLLSEAAKVQTERDILSNMSDHRKNSIENVDVDLTQDDSDADAVRKVLQEVNHMKKAGLFNNLSESESESEESPASDADPWCVVCNADATLQCDSGCGLFCKPCFLGTHQITSYHVERKRKHELAVFMPLSTAVLLRL
eukprot:CFRG6001T1